MNTALYDTLDYSELRIIRNRERRSRELRRHISMVIVGVVLFIFLLVYIFSVKSVASDGSEKGLYKYYKSVQVNAGDTLYDISLEYSADSQAFIDEVVFINNLNSPEEIKCGEYIIVPYYDVYKG